VTGAGDETLRFWDVFSQKGKSGGGHVGGSGLGKGGIVKEWEVIR
jgi:WD40 repeat protein